MEKIEQDRVDSGSNNRRKQSGFFGNLMKLGSFGLLVATAISYFGHYSWLGDLFSGFRVQFLLIGTVSGFLFLICRCWRWSIILIPIVAFNFLPIVKYFPYHTGPENIRGSELHVMTFNVLSHNRNYEGVIGYLREQDPDVVALLEVDPLWGDKLESLKSDYPHSLIEARDGNFGMALFSKHPFEEAKAFKVAEHLSISIEAHIKFDDQVIQIIAAHPIPPLSPAKADLRNENIMGVAEHMDHSKPRILVGDFNMTPWSSRFQEIKNIAEIRDSASGRGLTPTWYGFPTLLGGLKIDHVLVSEEFSVGSYEVGPDLGSDHRPVHVKLFIGNMSDSIDFLESTTTNN